LRARYYSPVLHRFISEDPLGFVGSGSNFYAYAFNNPISLSDPSGLNPAVAPGIVAVLEGLGYTQVEIDAAIAYLGAGGAETAGICASTVICGLIVLDTGLAINDGWQFYRLGVAYDWWGQPKPQPLAGRGCKSPRHSEGDCDDMFEADLETCRALKSRACYDQAMQRYSACQAGKTIPPFPFRMPN
jgi:uncharacterized protein RhaS with RHS repeats